jgi:hypothetical protein
VLIVEMLNMLIWLEVTFGFLDLFRLNFHLGMPVQQAALALACVRAFLFGALGGVLGAMLGVTVAFHTYWRQLAQHPSAHPVGGSKPMQFGA